MCFVLLFWAGCCTCHFNLILNLCLDCLMSLNIPLITVDQSTVTNAALHLLMWIFNCLEIRSVIW